MGETLADLLRVAQCNRFKFHKETATVKGHWCTTCRQFLRKRELCPVVALSRDLAKARP